MTDELHHVYLGPENWAGLWRNRHWLMSIFARTATVLYVEPYRTLRPTLAAWRAGQLSLAPWRWQGLARVDAGLYLYHQPPFAPATGLPLFQPLSDDLRRGLLRQAATRLGLERPIVWISRPWVAGLARNFDPCLTIYHVVDEYSAYPGQSQAERQRVRLAEAPLLRRADLVIVSSRRLLEEKRAINPRTFWVPNGVNQAGYRQHIQQGAPVPPELAAVPRPRLGYLGQIGAKLDFELLEAVARARPDWSLVFVGSLTSGHAQASWQRLRALPNVFHLGEVPAARVPEYVCGFDVGLMPYQRSDHTEFIDPLKLYDYLAAGLPIASVDLPALDGFRDWVHVGDTAPEFINAIAAALADHGPAAVAERRRLAGLNSWEQRAQAIDDLIQAQLCETAEHTPQPVTMPERARFVERAEPEPAAETARYAGPRKR